MRSLRNFAKKRGEERIAILKLINRMLKKIILIVMKEKTYKLSNL